MKVTLEILMKAVGRNVCLIRIVLAIELVLEINVKILVQDRVE